MIRRSAIAAAATATAIALTAGHARADGFTTTSGADPSLDYTFADSDSSYASIGGFEFGAGYSMSLDASASYDTGDGGITAGGSGMLEVPAKFFDKSVDIFKVTGNVDVDTDAGEADAGYELDVLGGVVSSTSVNLPFPLNPVNFAYTFVSVTEDFTVGPVPVTVKAKATGTLSVQVNPFYSKGKLGLTVMPTAAIDGDLSAGVGGSFDGVGASAGVDGSLTVLSLGLPLTVSSTIASTGITTKVSGTLNLAAMSGSVGLYAKVCVIDCAKWTDTIFSWNGVSWSKTLFSTSDTVTW